MRDWKKREMKKENTYPRFNLYDRRQGEEWLLVVAAAVAARCEELVMRS